MIHILPRIAPTLWVLASIIISYIFLPIPYSGYVTPYIYFFMIWFFSVYTPYSLPIWVIIIMALLQDSLMNNPFGYYVIVSLLYISGVKLFPAFYMQSNIMRLGALFIGNNILAGLVHYVIFLLKGDNAVNLIDVLMPYMMLIFAYPFLYMLCLPTVNYIIRSHHGKT